MTSLFEGHAFEHFLNIVLYFVLSCTYSILPYAIWGLHQAVTPLIPSPFFTYSF